MYGIEGLLAGRTLMDRYRIDAVIGRGGMGAVYRAFDTRLGREVAVKVISAASVDPEMHERLRARFQREARAAATLHHPNVVAVYDYGTDPVLGLDFLVMELLRGEDLATRLSRKGPPAVAAAAEILYQAARGLAAGHRAGLIHRDIKPGNLFLEPGDRPGDLHVKVLDFGIAELVAEGDQTVTHLTVVGRSPFSPAFASPEQLRGDRVTPATDVFSLGAVAFQMLTGKRAFASGDPRQMVVELSTAVASELPRVRGLSPELARTVRRALAPDPADRFPHAGALAEALAPFAAEPPTRPSPGIRDDDEGTMLYEQPLQPEHRSARQAADATQGTQLFTTAPPHPGAGTRVSPEMRAALAQRPAPAPPAGPARGAPPARQAQGSWFRRTTRTVWNFLVTAGSIALFGGSWFLAVTGLNEGTMEAVYAGATAAVLLTPLAIHRVTGRQGSYRFALFGSIAVSLAVVYLLGRSESTQTVLGALFLAQVTASFVAEGLTRRRRPAELSRDDP